MLDISWPDVETYTTKTHLDSEKQYFRFRLFHRLRDNLKPQEDPDDAINKVNEALETVFKDGWHLLTVDHALTILEMVLDHILPKVNFPGPDILVRPFVKRTIMSTAKPLAQQLLGKK